MRMICSGRNDETSQAAASEVSYAEELSGIFYYGFKHVEETGNAFATDHATNCELHPSGR